MSVWDSLKQPGFRIYNVVSLEQFVLNVNRTFDRNYTEYNGSDSPLYCRIHCSRITHTKPLLLTVGDQMRKYERLRNLREDFDMTQSEVGAYLHISQRSYAHYEAGTRDIPLEILIELANLYQVNLDYLVGRTNVKDLLP